MAALLVFIMATLAEKQKLLNEKGPFGSNVIYLELKSRI